MALSDTTLERAVLAGIIKYGSDVYYDVADLVSHRTFTNESNAVIYRCIEHIFNHYDDATIDVPSILGASGYIGASHFFKNPHELEHLRAISKFPVDRPNVRRFAAQIRKLEVARLIYDQLEVAQKQYLDITGEEPIAHILGIAENAIFDFSALLSDNDDEPCQLFANVDTYIEELSSNPVDQIGLPTGFSRYDYSIGGGLRPGTVNIIGARPKVGKSVFAINVALHLAKQNIPVLYLDTEMTEKDHIHRAAACLTHNTEVNSSINEIETGKFGKDEVKAKRMKEFMSQYKDLPLYHRNISGRPFEDQVAIMRRWLAKEVGIKSKHDTKPCLIIYDYIKLMSASELANSNVSEFQMLGFIATTLHNFAVKYNIPILSFVQLNRDGITKETADTASGSDRILWLCSNFTIYKPKSDEEIAQDGEENGNRKLVPIAARHGAGLAPGDYINMLLIGKHAKLIEGPTAYELAEF